MTLSLYEVTAGTNLPEVKRQILQEKVNLYAEASRDFNPIHINEEFARQTPAGGTIAHGMMTLAFISQMMTAAFGRNWLTGGKLDIRFKNPARPGDTITASGQVRQVEKGQGQTLFVCNVQCRNQKGEPVITGEARVRVADEDIR